MPFGFLGRQSFFWLLWSTNLVGNKINSPNDQMRLVKEAVFDVFERDVGRQVDLWAFDQRGVGHISEMLIFDQGGEPVASVRKHRQAS